MNYLQAVLLSSRQIIDTLAITSQRAFFVRPIRVPENGSIRQKLALTLPAATLHKTQHYNIIKHDSIPATTQQYNIIKTQLSTSDKKQLSYNIKTQQKRFANMTAQAPHF